MGSSGSRQAGAQIRWLLLPSLCPLQVLAVPEGPRQAVLGGPTTPTWGPGLCPPPWMRQSQLCLSPTPIEGMHMVPRWEQGSDRGRGHGSQEVGQQPSEPAPELSGGHREVEPDVRQRSVASRTMVQPSGRRGRGLTSQSWEDLATHGRLPGRGNLGQCSDDSSVSGSRPWTLVSFSILPMLGYSFYFLLF